MSLNISKTGSLSGKAIEPFITLPDGSSWQLLLFHYVNKGNNLFTQSNATNCNDFGLYSRLKWIDNFTYDNKYEFYVIQDGGEHRWTQTNVPTTSTTATDLTVITGNPVNGIAKGSQGNTYLGYNSWWGACGCWTSYTSGGKTGIPGFGTHGVDAMCENYLALYARIEKPKAFAEDSGIQGVEFYEY